MTQSNIPKKGTYVGMRVLAPANEMLYKTCLGSGVPVLKKMFDERLHTTIIYSRTHCPDIVLPEEGTKFIARPAGYEIFTGIRGEKILVLKLVAPGLTALHNKIMEEHGATHDYPYFNPHITLSYNYTDSSTLGILPFREDIVLGETYIEDLDLDWGRK